MHFKALSEGDFDRWTEALRTFVGNVQEQPPSKGQGQRATAIVAGGLNEMATTVDLVKIFGAVARMTAVRPSRSGNGGAELMVRACVQPIQELEAIHSDLKLHELHLVTPSPHANSNSSPKFKFRKKQGRQDDYFDIKPTAESLVKQLGQALATIKSQHEILAATINSIPQLGAVGSVGASSPTGGMRTYASRSSAYSPRPPSSTRSSLFSVDSGETDDYYEDAVPGEFVLEDEVSEEDEESEVEEETVGEGSFASLEEDEKYGHGGSDDRASEATTLASQGVIVQRRAQLPAPVTGDEFSMLSMLRKNVGKVRSRCALYPEVVLTRSTAGSLDHLIPRAIARLHASQRVLTTSLLPRSLSTSLSQLSNALLKSSSTPTCFIAQRQRRIRSSASPSSPLSPSRARLATSTAQQGNLCELTSLQTALNEH